MEIKTCNNLLCKNVIIKGLYDQGYKINIYPNLVNEVLNVDHSTIIQQIDIVDIKGVKMISAFSNETNCTISTHHFREGIYFFACKNQGGCLYSGVY